MIPVADWDRVDGGLERSWSFDDMAEAARCAQRIAVLCDEHDHHADVTFGWGHLKVRTTTHDAGHTVTCLLYTSPSPRDKRQSRMPSSA